MRSTANGGRGLCASTRAPTTPARAPTARKRRCAGSSRAAVGLPARRACARPPRTVGVTPPAAGVGVANGHTRAPPRACGCRGSPHARAHHRAQTVCAGASLQRAAVAAAARRACARPHAHGSVGASHPLAERGWVWSTATRVAAKGVPRPARTPMGALSPAERPHHTAQKPRADVFKENEYVEVPSERLRGATSASTCAQALPCGSHH